MSRIHALLLALTLAALALPAAAAAQQPGVNLDDPSRMADDKARDQYSKPLQMLEWAGLEPGAAVVDYHSGSGYNTWVLSKWVGPDGIVFTEDPPKYAKTLKERLATGDLSDAGNVVYVEDLAAVPADSIDLVLTVRNYHDVPKDQIPAFLAEVQRILKPGGLFVVADARTDEGRDVPSHRIADQVILDEVTGAGFTLVKQSDMLHNPNDDHQGPKWEEREKLDVSLFEFRAPEQSAEAAGS